MRQLAYTLAFMFILTGCSSTGEVPPPQSFEEPRVEDHPGRAAEAAALEDFRARAASLAAVLESGDIPAFVSARSALRRDMEQFLDDHPAMRTDPRFRDILRGVLEMNVGEAADTDSLEAIEDVDSLALSYESWPESDQEPEPVSRGGGDSPFPYLENERIEFWIRYYTGPGRERFGRALYRMELYRPVVEQILLEMDLPLDLVCVALIESGFNLKARSSARAVGPWQFIAGTARLYGLRVNWWYDERRDIVASTYAACNYLKDLYGIWSDWYLALAAYNCGEYRVARTIARQNTTDFWQLNLPRQTERYVPKFLATLYIVRSPETYGFTIPEVEPVKFDDIVVKDATDLKLIAQSAGSSVDVLHDLNPNLLRWCTPPGMEVSVKVPTGTGEICREKLESIPIDERVTWRSHRVRSGETLSVIARNYGTSAQALKDLNRIRNINRLSVGQQLIVPVHGPVTEEASIKPAFKEARRNLSREDLERHAKRATSAPAGYKRVTYLVKAGDTLGEIAERFRTRVSRIRHWNNLSKGSYIYAGQRLVIHVPSSFDAADGGARAASTPGDDFVRHSYTVKKGDSFYSISRKFNVKLDDLLGWNNMSARKKLYPGQTLKIYQKKS